MFTCLLLFLRTDTVQNYYSVSLIDNLFETSFHGVSSLSDVKNFLLDIGDNLLANQTTNTIPQIRGLSILVGPIRLRSQRTKKSK